MPESCTWVLLRGLGRDARHWGDFPRLLRNTMPNCQVLTPDLPGNGLRAAEFSACTIQGQMQAVRQHLHGKGHEGRVHLLALSLGGMVALEWASHFPEEVAGMVLINSSLATLAPFWKRLRPGNYPMVLQLLRADMARREALILQATSNRLDRQQSALPDWVAWQEQVPVSRQNLLRQLWAAARFRPPPAWPVCPALVVSSLGDRIAHPDCSQALADCTGWPLASHPTAGHDLPLDEPQWLANTVSLWQQSIR